jgi:hypothetical protein
VYTLNYNSVLTTFTDSVQYRNWEHLTCLSNRTSQKTWNFTSMSKVFATCP